VAMAMASSGSEPEGGLRATFSCSIAATSSPSFKTGASGIFQNPAESENDHFGFLFDFGPRCRAVQLYG